MLTIKEARAYITEKNLTEEQLMSIVVLLSKVAGLAIEKVKNEKLNTEKNEKS